MRKMAYICDRCGKTTYERSDIASYDMRVMSESGEPSHFDLCGACKDRFINMMDIFMKDETFEALNKRMAAEEKAKALNEKTEGISKYYTVDDIPNLSAKLKAYKETNNLSNHQMGQLIGVAGSTVFRWIDHGIMKNDCRTETKLNQFINKYLMVDSVINKEAI